MQQQIGQMKASGTFVPNERINIKGKIIERANRISLPKLTRSTFGNVNEIIIQKIKSSWIVTPNDNETHHYGGNNFI